MDDCCCLLLLPLRPSLPRLRPPLQAPPPMQLPMPLLLLSFPPSLLLLLPTSLPLLPLQPSLLLPLTHFLLLLVLLLPLLPSLLLLLPGVQHRSYAAHSHGQRLARHPRPAHAEPARLSGVAGGACVVGSGEN